ncbi:Amino-acid carrier protein AlsT [Terrisporobacter petrolearius]|uniref:alanine/glycine:cation symporter family protein n=1 Tax=Terrisporobacter petrolearius TaxID=1460447 RepID=UPI003365E339
MVEFINKINGPINSFVWGPVMLLLLVGFGIYMSTRTGFFQIRKCNTIVKNTIGSINKNKDAAKDGVSPYSAMSAAVASSVGVGSIAGVATAIVAGGPGAVFWMWMSAIFGMMTKYSEVVLAVYYRSKNEKGLYYGGPMYYMEKGLKSKGLATLFAIFAGVACFGTGNLTQSNSIATALQGSFSIPTYVTGLVLAVLTGLVIFGGVSRITKTAETLVPVMAVFYILGSLIVIFVHADTIPAVMSSIFADAFSFKSAGGGIMGYTIMRAMRFGVARGVFSNEAGLGSAPMLHSTASTDNPVKQGMWGIFEVFITTICICSMTALVILTTGVVDSGLTGPILTAEAFGTVFGSFGGAFVSIAITFFAFTSILGWSYYGECSWGYIFKGKQQLVSKMIKLLWIPTAFIGSVGSLDLIWNVSDTFNGLMIIPNIIALFGLSGVVIKLTKSYIKDPDSVRMEEEDEEGVV